MPRYFFIFISYLTISVSIYFAAFHTNYLFATDYSITSATTARITLTADDTLTVSGDGTIEYTGWPAVAANGVTFGGKGPLLAIVFLIGEPFIKFIDTHNCVICSSVIFNRLDKGLVKNNVLSEVP